jgi:hypothetical protein
MTKRDRIAGAPGLPPGVAVWPNGENLSSRESAFLELIKLEHTIFTLPFANPGILSATLGWLPGPGGLRSRTAPLSVASRRPSIPDRLRLQQALHALLSPNPGCHRWPRQPGPRALFRFAYLPASLPVILTALRRSVGTAVAALNVAEHFATRLGLGCHVCLSGSSLPDYSKMHAGVIAMSLLGLRLSFPVDWLDHPLCPRQFTA